MSRPVKMAVETVRKSNELGIIWGWASVADVEDLQGDTVPQEELIRAVYQFMEDYYAGAATILENHGEEPKTVLVESSLQFLAGSLRWWVGVKLLDPELRQAAREGEISGFSIGGFADAPEEQ